jgi:hypothetical protein
MFCWKAFLETLLSGAGISIAAAGLFIPIVAAIELNSWWPLALVFVVVPIGVALYEAML